jgi:polyhydroxyalkanoate synthesis regulator phasin
MNFEEVDFLDLDSDDMSVKDELVSNDEQQQVEEIDSLDDEILDFNELVSDEEDFSTDAPIAESETNDNPSSPNNKSLYVSLAKALSERGVITDFDETVFEEAEDGAEGLMNILQKTVDESISEYKSQFSGDTQRIIDSIEKGIPLDEFLKEKNKEINYKNISVDDIENDSNYELRTKILKDFYKETTNFSDARINKEIRRIVDLGEDVEESKDAAERLKEISSQRAKEALTRQEQARKQELEQLNSRVESLRNQVDEIDLSFLGGKITKKARDRYYNMLIKPVDEVNGQPINAIAAKRNEIGQEKFDIILAALLDKGVFDGDLSKLSAKQRRTAIDELQRTVENSNSFRSGTYSGNETYDSSADAIFLKKR